MMLVDTSAWIDHFNGHPSPEAARLHKAINEHENIALCGIVLTEILLGLRSNEQARKIENLLNAFTWLPEPDQSDYVQAATIFRHCRSKGVSIRSTIDCLIASLCIRHQIPLLTKDQDFNQIAIHHPLTLVKP